MRTRLTASVTAEAAAVKDFIDAFRMSRPSTILHVIPSFLPPQLSRTESQRSVLNFVCSSVCRFMIAKMRAKTVICDLRWCIRPYVMYGRSFVRDVRAETPLLRIWYSQPGWIGTEVNRDAGLELGETFCLCDYPSSSSMSRLIYSVPTDPSYL